MREFIEESLDFYKCWEIDFEVITAENAWRIFLEIPEATLEKLLKESLD